MYIYFIFNNRINSIYKNENIYDRCNSITNYLVESEKELGSLDDMFIGVSILICIYGWFFFGSVFFNYFYNISLIHVYVGFPILLFIILGMPSNMIWSYGILYPIYLRGSSNTTIFLLEFMYDILATIIMYIRLLVQNVRFIFMFFAFFECYEFFLNFIFILKSYNIYDNNYSILLQVYSLLLLLLNFIIFYLYTIGHLVLIIISHFFAYLVLIFWFFNFLYTTFLQEKLEIYFKFIRK